MATLLLTALLTVSVYAQRPNDITGVISVSAVRKAKSADKQKRSVIEITVSSSMTAFYVGGLYYCLQIGKVTASPAGGSSDNRRLFFLVSSNEWKKLKDGDPLWLTWGCRTPEAYESIKPFAQLNKKILGKKPVRGSPALISASGGVQPLGFTVLRFLFGPRRGDGCVLPGHHSPRVALLDPNLNDAAVNPVVRARGATGNDRRVAVDSRLQVLEIDRAQPRRVGLDPLEALRLRLHVADVGRDGVVVGVD
jgi:hypothetical protein